MAGVDRENDQGSVSLTASASTTGRIDMQRYAGGGVIVTALATGVTINWRVAMSLTGTSYVLKSSNTAVTDTIALNDALPIPDAAFGFPYVVPVLNAGTATLTYAVKG